jgi:hypothetical protein
MVVVFPTMRDSSSLSRQCGGRGGGGSFSRKAGFLGKSVIEMGPYGKRIRVCM